MIYDDLGHICRVSRTRVPPLCRYLQSSILTPHSPTILRTAYKACVVLLENWQARQVGVGVVVDVGVSDDAGAGV